MEQVSKEYLEFFRSKYNPSKIPFHSEFAAVIVEPRILPYLEFVIKNIIYFLPKWSIYIFHSDMNKDFIKSITNNAQNIHYINFTPENINIKQYNKLLLSLAFWQLISAETILIFQSDSYIRRHGIEEYLKYDYIGAPWDICKAEYQSGNGGFSLRKKSVMIKILKDNLNTNIKDNEDIFFGKELVKMGAFLPPISESMKFSVESIYYNNPVAVHKFWHFFTSNEVAQLYKIFKT
jgi:hypothetical protein